MTINNIELTDEEQEIFEYALWNYQLHWIGITDRKEIEGAKSILDNVGEFICKFIEGTDCK